MKGGHLGTKLVPILQGFGIEFGRNGLTRLVDGPGHDFHILWGHSPAQTGFNLIKHLGGFHTVHQVIGTDHFDAVNGKGRQFHQVMAQFFQLFNCLQDCLLGISRHRTADGRFQIAGNFKGSG